MRHAFPSFLVRSCLFSLASFLFLCPISPQQDSVAFRGSLNCRECQQNTRRTDRSALPAIRSAPLAGLCRIFPIWPYCSPFFQRERWMQTRGTTQLNSSTDRLAKQVETSFECYFRMFSSISKFVPVSDWLSHRNRTKLSARGLRTMSAFPFTSQFKMAVWTGF